MTRGKPKCGFCSTECTYIFRLRVCHAMTELIDRLRIRAVGQDERERKALDVEALAKTLLGTWKKEISAAKGVTFYMHACVKHLPDQIRSLPVDITLASGDSFEAKNQQLKRILRRFARNFISIIFTRNMLLLQAHQQTPPSREQRFWQSKTR